MAAVDFISGHEKLDPVFFRDQWFRFLFFLFFFEGFHKFAKLRNSIFCQALRTLRVFLFDSFAFGRVVL